MNCSIEHCENKIPKGSKSGLCKACYSSLYYWSDKTPTRIMTRKKKLRVFTERMNSITGTRK